ncbi:MAG: hypothetical protein MK212_19595, partial [Saprospiraceae bacterium]|nr:hypothetical protein [Saprospiraceae bacterium]
MAYDFCEISSVSQLCELSSLSHNIAGINEAILFPEQYILSTPTYSFVFDENKSAQLDGAIVLKAGATGYRFRFTSDTGSFSEKMGENSDGVFYDQLFTIDIPKDRPELTWLKYRMSRSRYTVLYRDKNGQTKIARNLRVKFDLDSGKSSSDYNGHTLLARKASTVPALHWNISSSSTLESLFQESRISFDAYYTIFDDGWQAGQKVNLPFEPLDIESVYAVYNNSLILQPGSDFLLQGNTITILFDDQPQSINSPSELSFFYACNKLNAGISSFHQQVIEKTASYLPGETLILDQAPAD